MTEQQQQWDEWNRQDEIERQESLTSHPRKHGDTLKKTVLKIASPWKIFVVQGGNRIKMVLLPVLRFTTCFHGNRDETAELGHSFIFEAWGMGAWDTAPAQQPRPLKGRTDCSVSTLWPVLVYLPQRQSLGCARHKILCPDALLVEC